MTDKGAAATPPAEDEVEASRMPLLAHLIELRQRLIRAIAAVMVAFVVCFIFAKQIYNVLLIPYVWASSMHGDVPRLIYTAPQEYFITQMKVALFGALFIAFPVIAIQIYKFVAPGLYKNERQSFVPYLIATPVLFTRRRAGGVHHPDAAGHALLPVAGAARRQRRGGDRPVAQGRRVSRPGHDADPRLRPRLPASGDPDAAWRASASSPPTC